MVVRYRIVSVSHHHGPRVRLAVHHRQLLATLLSEVLRRLAHPRHDVLDESAETRLGAHMQIGLRVPAADVAMAHGRDGNGFGDKARSEIAVDLVHTGEFIHGDGGGEEGDMGHGKKVCRKKGDNVSV